MEPKFPSRNPTRHFVKSKANKAVIPGLLISMPGTGDYFAAEDYGSIYGGMSAEKPYIESAREFGGLFVALGLIFLEVAGRQVPKTKE